MADACPRCVVGALERAPGQSARRDNAPSILCKRRHANSKLLTLQESVQAETLRLLTGARPLEPSASQPVSQALWALAARRPLCRLTRPAGADLRCDTCQQHVDDESGAVFTPASHAERALTSATGVTALPLPGHLLGRSPGSLFGACTHVCVWSLPFVAPGGGGDGGGASLSRLRVLAPAWSCLLVGRAFR